ncbi:MAG: SH3 domain-containing protein, partial [Steroidobacteraceae bacterium]
MPCLRAPLAGLFILLLPLLAVPGLASAKERLQVFVNAPYLELHTGPGRGYPVFYVVERNGSVDVLKRFTDWYKVRTERGIEGWVAQRDMLKTVLADGTPFTFNLGDRAGFTSHRFEAGLFP